MEAIVVRPDPGSEYPTDERCAILESWNRPEDTAVSIARARVAPGESTRPHRLRGVIERYVIVEGTGLRQSWAMPPRSLSAPAMSS